MERHFTSMRLTSDGHTHILRTDSEADTMPNCRKNLLTLGLSDLEIDNYLIHHPAQIVRGT